MTEFLLLKEEDFLKESDLVILVIVQFRKHTVNDLTMIMIMRKFPFGKKCIKFNEIFRTIA